jgi:hypothetical protein
MGELGTVGGIAAEEECSGSAKSQMLFRSKTFT